ncbi:hypothetical protein HQ585_17760 [candidate division KSB1 bacterium]|nr:hypothetical protein [candidate division KSB1 bacterium]
MGESFRHNRFTAFRIFILCLLALLQMNGFAQVGYDHDYPRLAIFVWGTHAPKAYFAKFDLVVTASNNSGFAQAIKDIDPETYILYTRDIGAGQGADPYYNEWTVDQSNGSDVTIYGGGRPLADITEFCPLVNGKRYNQVVSGYLSTLGNLNIFDGISSDGMMEAPGPWTSTDIDLDKNGQNDWNEHGQAWLSAAWIAGNNTILDDYRRLHGDSKLFLVNSGGMHDYGWATTNGMILEHTWALAGWNYFMGRYQSWMKQALRPHIMLMDGCSEFRETGRPAREKNDFQLMRFILTTTMLGDGYYDYHDNRNKGNEHFYVRWYDEYDVKMGYPTTGPQRILIEGPVWNEMAVWVRFFDNGAVIVNSKGKNQLVIDADLANLVGYDGPYYHFEGGQDPSFNNGEIFSDMTMEGIMLNVSTGRVIGEGMLLTNSPQKVISEITIDNANGEHDASTSPGSEPAALVGGWTNRSYGASYAITEANWMDIYGYAFALPGNGSTYAIFEPNIGVSGNYEVFEWHAFHGSNADEVREATNVPCTISLGSQRTVKMTINQSINYGKWNSLGTFFFSKGTDARIVITNEADGVVIADAFKFDYIGGESDQIPPVEPTNIRGLNITDSHIDFAWDPPLVAPDGDTAMFYQVYRAGEMIGATFELKYNDVNLDENTSYVYAVYSVDKAGNRSAIPASITLSTGTDITSPVLEMVQARNVTTVHVYFSEPVEELSAETESNFEINKNVSVLAANLLDDLSTVELNTSEHIPEEEYMVTITNVVDRSANNNIINPNSNASYSASADTMDIRLAADNAYELYVNGTLIGSDAFWPIAQTYSVPAVTGKNVIAIKGIDNTDVGGLAGLLVEIDFKGEHYVSNTYWKASNIEQTGWENVVFNDTNWESAASYGIHGSAEPWALGNNVENISANTNVHWIWTNDNVADDNAYFRFSISLEGDYTPPGAPTGITISQ